MNEEDNKPAPRPRKDEKPKISPKEDLAYRIKGLQAAKIEPGMSKQDIEALDIVIARLQAKQNS